MATGLEVTDAPCSFARAAVGTCFGKFSASRLLNTVPNTATPIEPPIERAKVATDVEYFIY